MVLAMARGDAIPLTGADCFLRAFDVETRRFTRASHRSQIVLRLGPGLSADALRESLHELARANPILRAPIRRRLGLAAPVYRLDLAERAPLPPVGRHMAKLPPGASAPVDGVPLPEVGLERINAIASARRGELFQADVVEYDEGRGGADVIFTWLHMLLDGNGSERFLSHWDAFARGEAQAKVDPPGEWQDAPVPGNAGERGARARSWQAAIEAFADVPPHSLAGPLRRVRQALRYPVYSLDRERSQQVVARAAERAGFVTPALFYLAASIRAHDAVFRARGQDPGCYVVPLPVNLRGKGSEQLVFRTRVSMLWFRVLREQTRDLDELVDALKRQRRDMLRSHMIENGIAAMDFARFAPAPIYVKMARRTFGGELCSFFFAFTGEFLPGQERFLGAPILNGFHVAPVPASPGSAAVMSLREGRLNVTHVQQQGLFGESEQALFRDRLFADLLGES